MDTSDSVDTSKMKDDSTQIPSPTSSIYSIRPLEWDSGADIGYQYKSESGLSTVERIAFVSGTVNLLENCKHTDRQFSKERRRHLGGPLAQSSPFLTTIAGSKEGPAASKNEQFLPKLVDYSVSEDHTLNQTGGNPMVKWFSELNVLRKLSATSDEDPKILTLENSKSLDDLYSLKRSNHGAKITRHSVINAKHMSNKSSKEVLSSSSAATLVPHLGLQMHRTRSDDLKSSSESTKDATKTHSIGSKKGSPCETENDNSYEEGSFDGGSFEYVPGSMYDSRMISNRGMSNNSSSLNTLSSEVIDGVDLLIDYVNNLRIPHKRQVLQKVTKFLSANENLLTKVRSSLRESCRVTTNGTASDDLINGKSNTESYLPSSDCQSSIRSNSKTDFSSNVVSSGSSKNYSHSQFPVRSLKQQLVHASETSNRCRSNKNNCCSSSSLTEPSSCRYSSCCVKSSNSSKCGKREVHSSNTYSLKQYLMKERNSHLMWIKSNIDHLNNLKKLCESQKILHSELDSLKKADGDGDSNYKTVPKIRPGDPSCRKKTATKKKLLVRQKQTKEAENVSSEPEKEVSSSFSGVSRLQSVNENTVSRSCSMSHDKRRNIRRSEMPHPPSLQDANECKCSCRHCCQSANKENIPINLNMAKESRTASCRKNDIRKPAVSYTLLFDKKTGVTASRKFKVQKYVRSESTTKTRQTINEKVDDTTSATELECTTTEARSIPVFSLQEYLTQNKPNYVSRAEYRRECLAEIGKLRELRDKNRRELLLAVRNVDEMEIRAATKSLPPPPLRILKIFDEKAMKEETKRKYQQLPEVQSKKVQVKRKLNYRHNHLMAEIYAKKLQKKVLRGQVHLANDVNLMSS